MDCKVLGGNITFLRRQRKWTKKQLAEKLSVSDKTVGKWESGLALPDTCQLPLLSEIFSVSIDFLLTPEAVNELSVYEAVNEYTAKNNELSAKEDSFEKYLDRIRAADAIASEHYARHDVKRGLRDLNGEGVIAGLTSISSIKGKEIKDGVVIPCKGELRYRGYDIKDLIEGRDVAGNRGFEETVFLLLFGDLPSDSELKTFCADLASRMTLPTNFVRDIIMKSPSPDIMNTVAKSLLSLAAYDKNVADISIKNVLRQELNIIAVFPLLAVYGYHAYKYMQDKESLVIHYPKAEYSTAENILYMLRNDGKFTPNEAAALDILLMLHAEHGGGNNSTFTTHVVTSSGTDTYSAITASLCSLKGFKHGGANIKVTEMLDYIKRQVKDWTNRQELTECILKIIDKEAFDKTGLVYGMGHAVYSISDPRADILKQFAEVLSEEKGLTAEFNLYQTIEEIAIQKICEKRRIYKGVSANVDFYSGFVYNMLNIPTELITALFAISRVSGWSAHRTEEIVNSGKIIRPAYKSVAVDKAYPARETRK